MKLTQEIFNQYVAICDADPHELGDGIDNLTEELGYENSADMQEEMYIWGVLCGDSKIVMQFYELDADELEEEQELWADERSRFIAEVTA